MVRDFKLDQLAGARSPPTRLFVVRAAVLNRRSSFSHLTLAPGAPQARAHRSRAGACLLTRSPASPATAGSLAARGYNRDEINTLECLKHMAEAVEVGRRVKLVP